MKAEIDSWTVGRDVTRERSSQAKVNESGDEDSPPFPQFLCRERRLFSRRHRAQHNAVLPHVKVVAALDSRHWRLHLRAQVSDISGKLPPQSPAESAKDATPSPGREIEDGEGLECSIFAKRAPAMPGATN